MRKVCFLTVLLVLAATASFAAPFVGTGAGQTCSSGALDNRYTLLQAPSGVPLTAKVNTGFPEWVGAPNGNCWINPSGNGADSFPAGYYDYHISFDWGTGNLSASFAADNNAEIWLNGVNTGIGTSGGVFGYDHLTPFTLTTADGLKDNSTNYIDFVVYNWQDAPGPTGLLVTGTVPEPGTMVLLGTGVLGLAGVLRRKLML